MSLKADRVMQGAAAEIPFSDALKVWTRIALLSFGGPAGQIAVMHRIIVEEKAWISETRFLHALNFCMLLPGPEATQLAVYIGWLMHRVRGGVVAGLLFILPGILAIMALSWIYAIYGNVGAVEALFLGLKAAVLAIVLEAVVRIGRRALHGWPMVALSAAAFVAIFVFDVPFPLIIAAAALTGFIASRAGSGSFARQETDAKAGAHDGDAGTILGAAVPLHARRGERATLLAALGSLVLWVAPTLLLLASAGFGNVFADVALFFSTMAVLTFGGAYAVLAWVAQEAVGTFGWLQPGEMLDGLGMAETTPGPLIMVTQFVGFMAGFRDPGGMHPLVAGTVGGLLTTWVTFAPSFLWIFLGAPYVEQLRENRALAAALAAITAAVVGVILNLAIWFALHVLFAQVRRLDAFAMAVDFPILTSLRVDAALLAAIALFAVFYLRAGILTVLAACSLAGMGLYLLGWTSF